MMIPVWLTDTMTLDLGRSIRYTLLWGLEGVVLRHLERGTRVPDVNEVKLRNRLADSDLVVAAVEPGIFESGPDERVVWLNDLERLEETAAFCKRIGCQRVVSGALPGAVAHDAAEPIRQAARVLARHAIQLCLRNAGDGRWTANDVLAVADAVGGSDIAVCWDPAAALLRGGEQPLDSLEAVAGRSGIVIVRDVTNAASGMHPARLGEGDLTWPEVLKGLARAGFQGPLCLEFHDATPAEALRDATTLIHMIRAARDN